MRSKSRRRQTCVTEEDTNAINDMNDINADVMRDYLNAYRPTKRDLCRPLKQSEQRELCQRVPCRVEMYRWNPVHDYVRHFGREGRLWHRSRRAVGRLLAKAVNRFKPLVCYSDREIAAARAEEWALRKKENLMRLRVWSYDRRKDTMLVRSVCSLSHMYPKFLFK